MVNGVNTTSISMRDKVYFSGVMMAFMSGRNQEILTSNTDVNS